MLNLTIFLELKKAYDAHEHFILLKKLHGYGIRCKAIDWQEFYLNNRKQFCSPNGPHSIERDETCGISSRILCGTSSFIHFFSM